MNKEFVLLLPPNTPYSTLRKHGRIGALLRVLISLLIQSRADQNEIRDVYNFKTLRILSLFPKKLPNRNIPNRVPAKKDDVLGENQVLLDLIVDCLGHELSPLGIGVHTIGQ